MKELDVNYIQFCPFHLNVIATLPCEMQKLVWPYKTVHSETRCILYNQVSGL